MTKPNGHDRAAARIENPASRPDTGLTIQADSGPSRSRKIAKPRSLLSDLTAGQLQGATPGQIGQQAEVCSARLQTA